MSVMRRGLASIIATLCLVGSVSISRAESVADGYSRSIKNATAVAPLWPNLFGDSTNMMNGSTTFSITDVSLPTNGRIPVSVGRTLSVDGQTVDQMGRGTSPDWQPLAITGT